MIWSGSPLASSVQLTVDCVDSGKPFNVLHPSRSFSVKIPCPFTEAAKPPLRQRTEYGVHDRDQHIFAFERETTPDGLGRKGGSLEGCGS